MNARDPAAAAPSTDDGPVRPAPLDASGRSHRSAIEGLFAAPQRHGFFQAIRLLERWFQQQEGLDVDQVLRHRLRFRNSLSLSFPASEMAEFTVRWREPAEGEGGGAADSAGKAAAVESIEITPAFLGLLGAGGALPAVYTELLAQREAPQRKDTAARAFLDIFLHRAASLFYLAWRKHRLPLQYESDRRERFLPLVLALAGLGHPGLQQRLRAGAGGVADVSVAHYAGVLRQRPASADQVRRVLAEYLGLPVRLDSFVGRWFTLPADQRSLLGISPMPLGGGAVLGERVWQRDLRMRLTLGPMTAAQFDRFLPGRPGAVALAELLRLMTGVALEYEVRLCLRADAVRPIQLTPAGGARLGWNTFLASRSAEADRCDAGYDLFAIA